MEVEFPNEDEKRFCSEIEFLIDAIDKTGLHSGFRSVAVIQCLSDPPRVCVKSNEYTTTFESLNNEMNAKVWNTILETTGLPSALLCVFLSVLDTKWTCHEIVPRSYSVQNRKLGHWIV